MTTPTDRPDVLERLAGMRPDGDRIDQAWDESRRQAVLNGVSAPGAAEGARRNATPASRARRSRWIGAMVGVAAVGAAALLLVSGFLVPTPPPVVGPEPTMTVGTDPTIGLAQTGAPEQGVGLGTVTVGTAGWKTFSSPEYPITFSYPADWRISFARYTAKTAKEQELTDAGIVEGCGGDGCTLYVSPPDRDREGRHSVVLMRNGFLGYSLTGVYHGATVLATVTDLKVWTATDTTTPSTAAIVTRSADGFCVGRCPSVSEFGPPHDYMLSTAGLAEDLAVGESNPTSGQPEAAFSFGTNWAPEGNQARIVATILASSRRNPGFAPTQPRKDSSGRYRFWSNDSMAAPALDSDVSTWKTLEVPDGNISVRVPPRWTVSKSHGGIILLGAPSGYVIDILTNGKAEMACRPTSRWRPVEKLMTLPDVTTPDVYGVSRPVELVWADATWSPVEVRLIVEQPSDEDHLCAQNFIDFGGKRPVLLGSGDNLHNPTSAELAQAAAILTSLKRL